MDDQGDQRTLEDLLSGQRFAMVTTNGVHGLTARPLTLLEHEDSTLRFLVSTRSEWVQELASTTSSVLICFTSPGDNTYVSLQGHTTLQTSKELVHRLWNPAANAFFEGPDDPDAVVLEAEVHDGEWWDGPGTKVGMAVSLIRRALGSEPSDQHGKVATNG